MRLNLQVLYVILTAIISGNAAFGLCNKKIRVISPLAAASRATVLEATIKRALGHCDLRNERSKSEAIIQTAFNEADVVYLGELNETNASVAAILVKASNEFLLKGGTLVKIGGYGSTSGNYFADTMKLGMNKSTYINSPSKVFKIEDTSDALMVGISELRGINYVREYNFPADWKRLVTLDNKPYVGVRQDGGGTFIVIGYSYFEAQSGTANWDILLANAAFYHQGCGVRIKNALSKASLAPGEGLTVDVNLETQCDNEQTVMLRAWIEHSNGVLGSLYATPLEIDLQANTTLNPNVA